MPWEHARYCGLGMDAIVIVCSRNTNIIMVWAWMLWLSFVSEHERPHGLGMDARLHALRTRTLLCVGHDRTFFGMLSEHEAYFGLGMVALFMVCSVLVCSRNTNIIMVWASSRYFWFAFVTRTLLWCGHGCTCYRMLSEHERYYGLGMDALAFAFALP